MLFLKFFDNNLFCTINLKPEHICVYSHLTYESFSSIVDTSGAKDKIFLIKLSLLFRPNLFPTS